ncbi:VOC family protein [Balneatrix alpica]|uniref:VOC family protein n=1 Tax=Balneatrix alpica TaxID=75684 RepID=UPI0027390D9A|nr:VOC family protein [Balneatrix alpica]
MLQGLNHLTLTVNELERSLAYYQRLGFKPLVRWAKGAYLTQADIWLCLNLGHAKPSEDYSHIAFSVDVAEFARLQQQLADLPCWQQNQSEGESLYLLDPDGHKLELHVGGMASRLASLKQHPYAGLIWLTD